ERNTKNTCKVRIDTYLQLRIVLSGGPSSYLFFLVLKCPHQSEYGFFYIVKRTVQFLMSSESDDHRITRYSSEHHDPVGANLDWSIILAAVSPIFFGFLLNIAVSPPSDYTFFDDMILMAALYAVTVATAMLIIPVIYHFSNYHRLDVERFLSRSRQYAVIGAICIMLAMYLVLGLLLNSKLPLQTAYGLSSLPFIFILFRFLRHVRN